MGRPRHWDDVLIENIYRLFGVSRYITWQAKTQGIDMAIYNLVAPAAGSQIAKTGKDLWDVSKSTYDPEKPFFEQLQNVKMLNFVPWVGKPIYWHFGGGSKKAVDQELKRYNAIKKGKRFRDWVFGKRKLTPTEQDAYREAIQESYKQGWISLKTKDNHFKGW